MLSIVVLASCTPTRRLPTTASSHESRDVVPIRELLGRQVRAWNDGDVEEFMRGYWRSSRLTFFSDGEVTRGWQETLDRYRRRYPDRAAMGRLSFEELSIEPVRPGLIAVSGIWRLDREVPAGGRFLLIFERHEGRWVIVVDSTTSKL